LYARYTRQRRTACADDQACAGEGVVAGVGAVPDKRNRDTGTRQPRRAGTIGRIAFPRTAAVAVAVCDARPWWRMVGRPARSPGGPRPHPVSCAAGAAVDRRSACEG